MPSRGQGCYYCQLGPLWCTRRWWVRQRCWLFLGLMGELYLGERWMLREVETARRMDQCNGEGAPALVAVGKEEARIRIKMNS